MPKLVDHTGKTFGRLTAIERIAAYGKETRYRCSCECGGTTVTIGSHLTGGGTRSCGCLRRETSTEIGHANLVHGGYTADAGPGKRRATDALRSAKKRCYDKKNPRYPRYGGRGITVCREWLASANQFYADMGDPPKGHSLNRINNDGDYTKENCEWADHVTQANNKSNNIRIDFDGRVQTASEWARELGVRATVVRKRLRRGWTAEAALTGPSRCDESSLGFGAAAFGISYFTASLLGREIRGDRGWRQKLGTTQRPVA